MLWWKKQRLKAKDPRTRLKVLDAMIASHDAHALEAIREMLKDESPAVRMGAAKGLGTLRDELSLPALEASLKDPAADVRVAVVQAIRQIGDSRSINNLIGSLKDDNHNVRWHAAGTLTALGWRPESDTDFILRSIALGQPDEIANHGELAVEVLVSMLQDPTCPRRRAVAAAMGKTKDPRVVKPLERALKDEDGPVRVAAIEALAQIGHTESGSALLDLLRDKDPHVRAAAVEALGRMGDVRVVDPIAKGLLDDASWDVRKLSVEALGRVRDERAASLLCHALNDRDHDVRQTAAQSLGQLPDKRSIGPLILALKDENSSVRQTAKASLRLLDHLWELSEAAEKAIPALEAAATHREYWVAQSASDALARITDARQKAGESHTNLDPAKEKRDRAIAILCEAARDFDRDLRQAAVEGLGRIGEFGAVAPLVTALNDADEWVGKAAALALNHLNWKPGANEQQQARRMNKLLGVK